MHNILCAFEYTDMRGCAGARVFCVLVFCLSGACFCLSFSVVCAFACVRLCALACVFVFVCCLSFSSVCAFCVFAFCVCARVSVRFVCVRFAFCVFCVRVFVCRFLVRFAFCVCACESGRLRVRFAFVRWSSRNCCIAATLQPVSFSFCLPSAPMDLQL